jgi:hypothetical protein
MEQKSKSQKFKRAEDYESNSSAKKSISPNPGAVIPAWPESI